MPALLAVERLTLGYLAYVTAVAWLGRRPRRVRWIVTAAAGADAAFIVGLADRPSAVEQVLREWLPGLQTLVAYWLSGLLFVRPMTGVERWLVGSDAWLASRLGARRLFDRTPTVVLEILELAYMTVGPMLPVGFGVVFVLASPPDADRFWTVVAAAAFGCYGMLPWIQTRPPFAITDMSAIAARSVRPRALTRAVMGRVSIYWNTLPSGHAATSLAVALAVQDQVPALGPAFLLWSCLITLGSVVGRYHYVIDAATGAVVGLAAWLILGRLPS